jgi:hypothetical protein
MTDPDYALKRLLDTLPYGAEILREHIDDLQSRLDSLQQERDGLALVIQEAHGGEFGKQAERWLTWLIGQVGGEGLSSEENQHYQDCMDAALEIKVLTSRLEGCRAAIMELDIAHQLGDLVRAQKAANDIARALVVETPVRKSGGTKLVYDKATRTIVKVAPDGSRTDTGIRPECE